MKITPLITLILTLSTVTTSASAQDFKFEFGYPTPDASPEENWVQTNDGEGWFVLFRFYGPEKEFYDHSWKLPDFEKIK